MARPCVALTCGPRPHGCGDSQQGRQRRRRQPGDSRLDPNQTHVGGQGGRPVNSKPPPSLVRRRRDKHKTCLAITTVSRSHPTLYTREAAHRGTQAPSLRPLRLGQRDNGTREVKTTRVRAKGTPPGEGGVQALGKHLGSGRPSREHVQNHESRRRRGQGGCRGGSNGPSCKSDVITPLRARVA